jgi:hypothetical protein
MIAGFCIACKGANSNNRLSEELKRALVASYRTELRGFGPTLRRRN